MFFKCMSPSAISQENKVRQRMVVRSSSGAVDSGRTARIARSMVLSYFSSGGSPRTEQKSSMAKSRVSFSSVADIETFDDQRRRHAVRHVDERGGRCGKAAGRA